TSVFLLSKTIWDRRNLQSFGLEIEAGGGTFTYRLEIHHPPESPGTPQIHGEALDFDGRPLFRFGDGQVRLFGEDSSPGATFPFRAEHSFLPNLELQNGKIQVFKAFMAGLNIFQLNPFSVEPSTQQDQPFLQVAGTNFPSWLRFLSEERPRAKRECEEHLAQIIPGFQNFRFMPAGDRKVLLADFAREGETGYSLPFARLSEGHRILSILDAIAYGLVGSASVLCFDEPENFISLPEVQPWLQALRDLVEERGGQLLLISHHPEVIDYLAADSAFRFDRPNGDLVRISSWIPDPARIMKPSEILVRGG
ncbi:MAG: ATP-binding protein, partial [Acidobacteria bacterium]|nr:ATP-binding protein [Acidobacteriota bacterium]